MDELDSVRGCIDQIVIVTYSNGEKIAEVRNYPWVEDRYAAYISSTNFRFTGQRRENYLDLYWYGSRWYDPLAARFIQADTLVPNGVQGPDRYAYVNNNPVRYTDPSGHCIWDLCIVEEIELVELALILTGGAAAIYTSTPSVREATTQVITEGLDWVTEQFSNGVDRLRTLVKSTEQKPLTSDEKGNVDKLNKGLDDFLAEHPDLAEEAERVAEGETLPQGKDHVTEAKNLARGLENSIEHLQKIYDRRTAEAQKAIDLAIENAQNQLDKLRGIIGDW